MPIKKEILKLLNSLKTPNKIIPYLKKKIKKKLYLTEDKFLEDFFNKKEVGSNFKKIWKEVRHEIVHRQIVSTLDSHKNNSRIHGYRVYKNFEKKKYKELITICFKYLKKGLESFYILIS